MTPAELERLAAGLDLDSEARFPLRVAFGVACAERVEHLLTDPAVNECLAAGKRFVADRCSARDLARAAGRALVAAEYAAYAAVYAYASHAVTDLSAYAEEHAWQVEKLRGLAADEGA